MTCVKTLPIHAIQRKARDPTEFQLISRFQVFLNIVLDEAVEEKAGGEKVRIGMVVRDDS